MTIDQQAIPGLLRISLPIRGMTCSACAVRLEKALGKVAGVNLATVNFALERADVAYDPTRLTPPGITTAIVQAGFFVPAPTVAMPEGGAEAAAREQDRVALRQELIWLLLATALAAPLLAQMGAMTLNAHWHLPAWFELLLATPVQFIIGARFYKSAFQALRARSANMDVLVVLGTSAAFGYSVYLLSALGLEGARGKLYFEASVVIITLVLLGKYLETRAKRGTTAAIRHLMDLRPQTARLRRADGTEQEVPINQIQVGDLVVVRPGERVPVDGEVLGGRSALDESLITGESLPVDKQPGSPVTGGAINGTGLLEVRARAVGADSTLSRIIRLVENAQSGKAPVQRLVDKISGLFVPLVVVLALITFAGWFLFSGNFEQALISAVAVLVIACPCALGLATPTAIMTGTGAAARCGILIKDVASLERAYRINTLIFDKTGTLTTGHPTLVGMEVLRGEEDALLQLAASVQFGSEHPLARALLKAAAERTLPLLALTDFRSYTGRGVSGVVAGREVFIGNRRLLEEHSLAPGAAADRVRDWELKGRTAMLVADREGVLGVLAVADALRPEAREAVASLSKMGIRTLMLSGDAELVAQEVGRQAGVDEIRGGVGPESKAQIVQALQGIGRVVGMLGDGINDAPALAAADVGIAMGTGTDIAMETAGITLMRGDPRLVAGAIQASRATFRKIKQNLFWAFFYNLVGIPLAAFGFLSPALAGAAMALSSVSVVANSLLLRRWRPRS